MFTNRQKNAMKKQLLKLKKAEATLDDRSPGARKLQEQAAQDVKAVADWLAKQPVFFQRRGTELYLVDEDLNVIASTEELIFDRRG